MSGRKCNILIVFDDMIADVISNKKLNQVVTELFIRGKKLNIFTVFTAHILPNLFSSTKKVRINCIHFLIMEISNKRGTQPIPINHSSDISSKDFINIYEKCIVKPYYFLVIDIIKANHDN